MTYKKRNGLILLILVMILTTGCRKQYEPIAVPALEEASGDVTPENPSEAEVEISAHEVTVTTETAPMFAAVDETVYVTADQVNARKSSGPSGEVITKLKKGTTLARIGYNDSWSKVRFENQECFVSSQYLSKIPPETQPETTVPVASTGGSGKIIAIDPGHQTKGNSEKEPIAPGSSTKKPKVASGTQGTATKIPEYKLTLAVSLKLKQELIDRGYQVYMIRETNDVNISNSERAEMANNSGADIFVRVHANGLSDSSVHGTLTMCQTSKNPYNGNLYGKSAALSRAVTNGVCARTDFQNRGVQETDSMSGINWCKIPVTIVEMGFMSNAEEDRKMAEEDYQNKIAKGIADGIDAYYAAGN